ncbi:MAG: helix-turn-helix domain-containing protein [Bacilli bacterium]|nr:helix-turn-helix domain-containing protein [Mollicutes bacterium]MDY4052916.1 helix-turn-helix domain-containing protein [Bacilli bacterium]MDY4936542.1 helix-turn-helix domain-containing protein [Candidatus Enteromonas sp.]
MSLLSHLFAKEKRITISDYIMKEKIEKTKRLIRYSDKPVTAIAAYLRFSSQSHFSNTFHKYTSK